MALISITGAEVDVLRGPRGLAGADGGSGGGDPPDIASQPEAEAGADNTKMMTPLRSSQAIAALQRALASQAEAEAGSNNTKDMTALRVAQFMAANNLWVIKSSHSMHFGGADGMDFDAQVISGPINRNVWTPQFGSVPAIDYTPKGIYNTDYVAIGGRLGWNEYCSSDFLGAESGLPFHSMRMSVDDPSVLGRGGSIGTHVFTGETIPQPWELMVSGVSVGRLNDPHGTLFTKGGTRSGTYTIADNGVQAIDVPGIDNPRWATLHISRNSTTAPSPWGTLRIKAGTSAILPVAIQLIGATVDTNFLLTTGVLTGTTTPVITAGSPGGQSTGGTLALSAHTDSKIYIQNRLGAPIIIGTHWIPQS